MTKLKKGILGPISGKLGPVVGATWKGISYLRSAPKINGSTKRSPAQIENQYKFKYLHQWLIPFHPYINIGFKQDAIQKTEINAAFTANYHHALTGTYPNYTIDHSKVRLSVGKLQQLNNPTVAWVDAQHLLLQWDNSSLIAGAYDDQLMLVVYSPSLAKADGFIGGVKRVDTQCLFAIDQKIVGQDLEVYVSLIALNGKKIGNSFYLGRMLAL